MSEPLKVVLIDDHALCRRGLSELLQARAGITVLGTTGSADEAVRLLRDERPDLAIMDLRMLPVDGHALLARLRAEGVDPGDAVAAERASAHGLLRWRIAGRADGTLLFGGALPTLIEWDGPHPAEHLPPSPVTLQGLSLAGVPPPLAEAIGLHGVRWPAQGPALSALFATPRGEVRLGSDTLPTHRAP
jgi:CheY-like chemotaxis protein